jgi:hypothetical protein
MAVTESAISSAAGKGARQNDQIESCAKSEFDRSGVTS